MTDYTKENDWVHDIVIACKQDPSSIDIDVVALYHVIDAIRQDEREACAALCDDWFAGTAGKAIRERGEK